MKREIDFFGICRCQEGLKCHDQGEEESDVKDKQAKELDTARQELISLKQLTKRQEQALTKKDKQIQEQTEEISSFKTIQEQIFNLSKRAKV